MERSLGRSPLPRPPRTHLMSQNAVDYVRSFIAAEHGARVAIAVERDAARVQEKIAAVDAFFGPGLDSRLFQPEDADDDYFEQMAEQVSDEAPRTLMLVRGYRHPALGEIHRCYTTSTWVGKPRYFNCFYLGETAEGMRIVARYTCNREHSGWDWSGGASIGGHGEQLYVERFVAPADPRDLEDYESDEARF